MSFSCEKAAIKRNENDGVEFIRLDGSRMTLKALWYKNVYCLYGSVFAVSWKRGPRDPVGTTWDEGYIGLSQERVVTVMARVAGNDESEL